MRRDKKYEAAEELLEPLARTIAVRLFTNGSAQVAGRLVMEPKGGNVRKSDLGGWCESAVVHHVLELLVRHHLSPNVGGVK